MHQKLPSSSQRRLLPYASTDRATTAVETTQSLRTQLQDETRRREQLEAILAEKHAEIQELKDSLRELRRVRSRARKDVREAASWERTRQDLEAKLNLSEKDKSSLKAQIREIETREDELEQRLRMATTVIEIKKLPEEDRRLLWSEKSTRSYQKPRRSHPRRSHPNEAEWIIRGAPREDRRPRTTTYYSMPRGLLWSLT
jgi:chromosome segregation ATPase